MCPNARVADDAIVAVDLNFGCPQGIARKGRYGAFLMDEPDVMVALVQTLAKELSVPVTAKLRLLPTLPTEGGRTSGGVGILVRNHIGIAAVDDPADGMP